MNAVSFQNFLFLNGWQAVKEIYEIVPARKWRAEEKQINKIVFIGNHLMVLLHYFSVKSFPRKKKEKKNFV